MLLTKTNTIGTLILSVLLLIIAANVNAAPVQWKVSDGGNGHIYEAVLTPSGISWDDANTAAAARGQGWHLATITSMAENAFVFNLIDDPAFWRQGSSINSGGPWLGALNNGPNVNDFEWVTGEPFSFENWAPFEPNGSGGLPQAMHFFGFRTFIGSEWNDVLSDGLWNGYVLETVPIPATVWLFGSGLLGLIGIARRKKTA